MEIQLLQSNVLSVLGKTNQILVNELNASSYEKARVLAYIGVDSAKVTKREDQIILAGSGSYEIGGIEIVGVSVGNGTGTIYVFDVDGVSVAVVPGLDEALLDKKIERLEEIGVDICVLMEGKVGHKTMHDTAKRIGANYIVFTTNVVDLEANTKVETLKVTPETLPEGSEVVILETNGR